ncbi:hypothetical protein N9I05_01460 [Pseudomonadales bacterium]|jgi:hypothetical protein|nr:hypothetical protein [Pseudomonadales bacterium]
MAKWGQIPNISTQQELIAVDKKVDTSIRQLNSLKPKLVRLSKVDPDSIDQTVIEIEEVIQELNSLKTKRRRLIGLLSGDE